MDLISRNGGTIRNTIACIKTIKFCKYCRSKAWAQGFLDVALIMVNVAHLVRVLQRGKRSEFYYYNLTLVGISIALEVTVAILLFIKERWDIDDVAQQRKMDHLNNILVWVVFMSVVTHVFVAVFVEEHHMFPAHHTWYRNCSITS